MYVYVKICRNITSTGARGQVSFFNEVDMSHDDDNDETDPYQVSNDERRKCLVFLTTRPTPIRSRAMNGENAGVWVI